MKMRIYTLIMIFVAILVAGVLVGSAFFSATTVEYQYVTESGPAITTVCQPFEYNSEASFAVITVPAVDNEGNGVTTVLTVQAVPGYGRVLNNIDRLLFWTDTQNSIRTARTVAENITGKNISGYDLIYTIMTNATSVEGPSAGAALTIATIAALEKKQPDQEVMITGTINHDGTIGPIGEALAKAKAAKEAGARIFLVPPLQSRETIYRERTYCEQIGPAQLCSTERVPETVDIGKEAGIEVHEVSNIVEAMAYFWL